MKECTRCHKKKSSSEYYVDNKAPDRRQKTCKSCKNEMKRASEKKRKASRSRAHYERYMSGEFGSL